MLCKEGQPPAPAPQEPSATKEDAPLPADYPPPGDLTPENFRNVLDTVIADQLARPNAHEPTSYQRFLDFFHQGDETVYQSDLESAFGHNQNPTMTVAVVKHRLNRELREHDLRIVRVSGYRLELIRDNR